MPLTTRRDHDEPDATARPCVTGASPSRDELRSSRGQSETYDFGPSCPVRQSPAQRMGQAGAIPDAGAEQTGACQRCASGPSARFIARDLLRRFAAYEAIRREVAEIMVDDQAVVESIELELVARIAIDLVDEGRW